MKKWELVRLEILRLQELDLSSTWNPPWLRLGWTAPAPPQPPGPPSWVDDEDDGDVEDGDVEDDGDDEDGEDEDGDDDHLLHHVASSQEARVETPGDHGLWVRLDKAVQGDL